MSASLTSLTKRHPFLLAPPELVLSATSQLASLLRGVLQLVFLLCATLWSLRAARTSGDVRKVEGKEGDGIVDKWPVVWHEKDGLGASSR